MVWKPVEAAILWGDIVHQLSGRANVPSKEAIQSTVVAYCAALGAMDADAVAEAFASDGVSHDPVGTAPHAGRDAIRQFMQSRLTAAERVSFTPNQIFVAGDSAAFKWTAQLTTKQGQSVGVEGIDVIHLSDDGKIQTLHAYWDPTPVLAAQLNSPAADDWCACIVGSRRSAMSLSALGGLTQQELEERARRSAHGSQRAGAPSFFDKRACCARARGDLARCSECNTLRGAGSPNISARLWGRNPTNT